LIIIKDRSHHRCCSADGVTGALNQGEGNSFIRLDRCIRRWVHGEYGSGCTSCKGDGLGGWRRGDAGVVGAECSAAGQGVVDGEGPIEGAIGIAGEGVDQIAAAIL